MHISQQRRAGESLRSYGFEVYVNNVTGEVVTLVIPPDSRSPGEELESLFRRLPEVREIVSRAEWVDQGTLKAMAHLEHLEQLTLIGNTRLEAADYALLAPLDELDFLALRGSQVDDHVCEVVADLRCVGFVDLSRSSVTDGGVAKLARMPALKVISAQHTNVAGAFLDAFVDSVSLESVVLYNNKIDKNAIRRFRQLRPDVAVNMDGSEEFQKSDTSTIATEENRGNPGYGCGYPEMGSLP